MVFETIPIGHGAESSGRLGVSSGLKTSWRPRVPLSYTRESMTIDERLEALTQTVELIAHMQQAEERRAAERDAKYHERFTRILDLIENHEHRIERLEDH